MTRKSQRLNGELRHNLVQRACQGPIEATVPFWGDSLFPRGFICIALGDKTQNRVLCCLPRSFFPGFYLILCSFSAFSCSYFDSALRQSHASSSPRSSSCFPLCFFCFYKCQSAPFSFHLMKRKRSR